MASRGRSGTARAGRRTGRWWRVPLVALLTLAGLVGLGWVVVWLRRDDPPPEESGSVTQSPGPPASRAVHRVEPSSPPSPPSPSSPPSALSTTSAPPSRATGVVSGRSELTRVQGIGARSAAALEAAGIDGLRALAAASPAEVSDALAAGGLRRSTTYATWPGQARELLEG